VTIDIHAHTIPEGLVRSLAAEVPALAPQLRKVDDDWLFEYPDGRRSGPVPPGMFDLGARLDDMDKCGVDVQALSVPPTHFAYRSEPAIAAAATRLHNDEMIAMARAHPDRFVVLGALPLQDTDRALEELARLVDVPEVAGVELGTNVAGRNLDDEGLAPVWSALDEAGLAVVLHPDAVAGADRMQDHYLHNFVGNPTDSTLAAGSLIFGGVLVRNPAVRVALLHGGGFLPYQIGRFEHGWRVRPEPRRSLDVNPRELLGRFWFDTLTHDRDSLRFLLERVGPSRLCLGSDYPFDMADPDPVGSVRAAVGEEHLESVLETTPRELLTRRPGSQR
jgi:aminocarboxymuconate-semialdehyde decarboxylase